MGVVVGIFVVLLVFMVYRKWDKKKQNIMHEQCVKSTKSRISFKTSAKWFHVTGLEHGFSRRNVREQGRHGIVYKGTRSYAP